MVQNQCDQLKKVEKKFRQSKKTNRPVGKCSTLVVRTYFFQLEFQALKYVEAFNRENRRKKPNQETNFNELVNTICIEFFISDMNKKNNIPLKILIS